MKWKKVISILLVIVMCMSILVGCGKDSPRKITKDDYDRIRTGMTISEVIDKIGLGEVVSEERDGEAYVYVHKYKGKWGGSATIIFRRESISKEKKVVSKTQDKLK